jgi:type I restriction enzyme S subunit
MDMTAEKIGFKKYPAYKESGVEWLGNVPAGWQIVPGLKILKERNEKNIGLKEKTVLSLSYGRVIVKDDDKLTGLVPESFETYQLAYPGDIIIRPTDLQNDKTSLRTGLVKDQGIITSAYVNLQIKELNSPSFYHYFLHAVDITKVLYGLGSGLRQNIDFRDFRRFSLVLPPFDEQTTIANFLDQKTAQINQAIAQKEKQIDLLKERRQILIHKAVTLGLNQDVPLKESGVEWIGEIPEHWEVLFNRRLFREKSRSFSSSSEQALSLSQVDGVIRSEEMKERSLSPSHRENFKLCLPGDLVVNRFKGHLGVFFKSNYRGIITFHYGVFEPKENVESKYFEYLFHINEYKAIYAGASNGMTIGLQNLSNQNFYQIKSIVPPISEQYQIVHYCDDLTSITDKAISCKQSEIEKLKEYKATLITSAVTGKIKVS